MINVAKTILFAVTMTLFASALGSSHAEQGMMDMPMMKQHMAKMKEHMAEAQAAESEEERLAHMEEHMKMMGEHMEMMMHMMEMMHGEGMKQKHGAPTESKHQHKRTHKEES